MPEAPFLDFAIALFIGALVGLEREQRRRLDDEEPGVAGIRTFILFAEAGALAAWLSIRFDSPIVFVGIGALVTAGVVAAYVLQVRADPESLGLTSEIAAVVVFLLGGTAVVGYRELAVALAIATSAVLAFKEPLHGLIERVGRDDLYAALKLLVATFVVLPLLPDRPIDPWGAFNPARMWWLVILISGLSLLGYLAARLVGPERGTAITGLLGGLASSTAVTLSLSKRTRDPDAHMLAGAAAAGILLSWAVMFARVLVEVAVVHTALVRSLIGPLAVMGVVVAIAAAVLYLRPNGDGETKASVPLKNPFSLRAAIQFAAFFSVVVIVVALAQTYLPATSLYVVAAIAGLTDVDAITLSMAGLAKNEPASATIATRAIVIAVISNTIVKAGLVAGLGAPALRRRLLVATACVLVAGSGALLLR